MYKINSINVRCEARVLINNRKVGKRGGTCAPLTTIMRCKGIKNQMQVGSGRVSEDEAGGEGRQGKRERRVEQSRGRAARDRSSVSEALMGVWRVTSPLQAEQTDSTHVPPSFGYFTCLR